MASRILLWGAALALSGCLTLGVRFTKEQLEQVQLGMTGDQVVAVIGGPYQMTTQPALAGVSPAREIWSYVEVTGLGGAKQGTVVFEEGRVVQVYGLGIAKSTATTGNAATATQ